MAVPGLEVPPSQRHDAGHHGSVKPPSFAGAAGRGEHQTMLGVAMPGIAPIARSDAPPAAAGLGPGVGSSSAPSAPRGRPVAPAAIPAIIPAPPTFIEEPLPAALVREKKRGAPIVAVAGGVAVLALVAGLLVYFFWKGGAPVLVKPQSNAQGGEQLRIRCETCPDGTVAKVLGASATFRGQEASVDLTTPLKLGDNPIEIVLDRPNAMGRDETVKAVASVFYRIRADLTEISSKDPVILVNVEAVPGTRVTVDGTALTLDASGKASHAVDIRSETDGASDEGKVIEKIIPYEVVTPASAAGTNSSPSSSSGGSPERGTVSARVGVVPLHIDAPGALNVTDSDRFTVAGRTAKGATVSVNGRALSSTTGIFSETFELPSLGETAVEIRSTAPHVASRTARMTVRRVSKLADEAAAFDAANKLRYDDVRADIDASIGKNLSIEGPIIESRTLNHQTVAIVDDQRGCAKSPCIVRVVHGGQLDLKPRDVLRAFGRVTKAFAAPDGTTVPEVEASFVLRGKSKGS